MPDHSPALDELVTALSAAQGEFEAIGKTASNPFFKSSYAPLPEIVKAAAPILAKHGLAISQFLGHDERGDTLTTWLLHKSGQFITDTMRLKPIKDDPQAQGSATTYGRRYAYMAALGLVADDDDDGNAASQPRAQARAGDQPKMTARKPEATKRAATPKQRGLINAKAAEKNLSPLALLNIMRACQGGEPIVDDVPDDQARDRLKRGMDRMSWDLVDPILEAIKQIDDVMPEPVA